MLKRNIAGSIFTLVLKEKPEMNQKKIKVSSVIAGINVLIFIWTVYVIFNNHWIDFTKPAVGSTLSYDQLYVIMIFYLLVIVGAVIVTESWSSHYYGRDFTTLDSNSKDLFP